MGETNPNANQGSSGDELISSRTMLGVAARDIYRKNAFRITGLAVDATARDIAKQSEKLRVLAELGQGGIGNPAAFALCPPPGPDDLRNAIQSLKDPERRLVDELLWFWPQSPGGSQQDPPLQALARGETKKALLLWDAAESDPATSMVARHNIAVLHHMLALDRECLAGGTPPALSHGGAFEQQWQDALARFDSLMDDESFWERIATRARQIDELRLTDTFLRGLRASFPIALGQINAGLAIHYTEKGHRQMAGHHARLLRDFKFPRAVQHDIASIVLGPVEARVKTQTQLALERGTSNPETGANVARELLKQARSIPEILSIFDKVPTRLIDVSNEVAVACAKLAMYQYKSKGDDQVLHDLLQAALPFAMDSELRQQLDREIASIRQNLRQKELEPIYRLIKQLRESNESPEALLGHFKEKISPFANYTLATLAADSNHKVDLSNCLAQVLRELAMKAWNTMRDIHTATEANQLALHYAVADDIRNQLLQDKDILAGVFPHRQIKLTPRGIVLLVAMVIGLASKCASNSQSSGTPTYKPLWHRTR